MMTHRMQSLMSGMFVLGFATNASAITIGAYAVGNHSPCGQSSIPETVVELDKFFASKDLPADAVKNFYWKEKRVQQNQWVKDGDHKASTEAATGFDGADASLLTYIASHGVTSRGEYKALAGSPSNGGCYISSNSLELGNNNSRYVILSTCQGLKIGSGDNPTATGENPSKTWKNASKGLNCIFGYSNNMADANEYGSHFLSQIKSGQVSLSEAFLTSSEAVARDNVPAVLCFGATQDDATAYIRDNKSFEEGSRSNDASAWVYRIFKPASSSIREASEVFASNVSVAPVKLNANQFSKSFELDTSSYDAETNVLRMTNDVDASTRGEEVPSVEEAKKLAMDALTKSGLAKQAGKLVFDGHADDVLGGSKGSQRVIQRKVIFKQALNGFQTLGQAGSIEVVVGAGGVVHEVKASLLRVTAKSGQVKAANVSAKAEDFEAAAIKKVAQKIPGATYKVVRSRFGYDAGSFFAAKQTADAVVEVSVEATKGGFARRYLEKIKL